jgi:hypothetical protein
LPSISKKISSLLWWVISFDIVFSFLSTFMYAVDFECKAIIFKLNNCSYRVDFSGSTVQVPSSASLQCHIAFLRRFHLLYVLKMFVIVFDLSQCFSCNVYIHKFSKDVFFRSNFLTPVSENWKWLEWQSLWLKIIFF